jgi:hypothetical protein
MAGCDESAALATPLLSEEASVGQHEFPATALIAAALSLASSAPSGGIVGGFVPTAEDTRFDAVAAFGRTINLDCSNQCSNHFACGTLIDCEWMLMARHLLVWGQSGAVTQDPYDPEWFPPPPGYWSFRFRRNPDGSLGEFDATLPDQGSGSFFHMEAVEIILPESLDVALVRLKEPIAHIEPIPVRFRPSTELPLGSPIMLAGWGRQFAPNASCEDRQQPTQQSRKLKVAPTVTLETDEAFLTYPSPCDANCECGEVANDSGGPVLIETPCGEIEIIAVISGDGLATLLSFYADSAFPIPILEEPCPSDLNVDGQVDGQDLGELLLQWGNGGCGDGASCAPDLDCNGVIDGSDLGALLLAWGACPFAVGCSTEPGG